MTKLMENIIMVLAEPEGRKGGGRRGSPLCPTYGGGLPPTVGA